MQWRQDGWHIICNQLYYLSQCILAINNNLQNNLEWEFWKQAPAANNHEAAFIHCLWGPTHPHYGIYVSEQAHIM